MKMEKKEMHEQKEIGKDAVNSLNTNSVYFMNEYVTNVYVYVHNAYNTNIILHNNAVFAAQQRFPSFEFSKLTRTRLWFVTSVSAVISTITILVQWQTLCGHTTCKF